MFLGLFFVFSNAVFAQIQDDSVYESCAACNLTPDSLTRYMKFVRSVLDVLDSNPKINISQLEWENVEWRANTLINSLRDTSNEYWNVVAREWKYVGGKLQWWTREVAEALWRDFLGNFARNTVAGLRTSALERDIEKLEKLDESIDKEAISHINHFRWKDIVPDNQITKINSIFDSYSDIFATGDVKKTTTYKDIIHRMNMTNRKVKNHITTNPKWDFSIKEYDGITFTLNPQWVQSLKVEYNCVIAVWWLNCNPSYGKTAWLRKEFGRSAWNELTQTYNKFKETLQKLSIFYNKDDRKEYFGWYFGWFGSERWTVATVNGRRVDKEFFWNIEPWKWYKDQKTQLKKIHDECNQKISADQKNVERDNTERTLFNRKTIGCRDVVKPVKVDAPNITESEESKLRALENKMNNFIQLALSMNDEESTLIKLASPLSVTHQAPLLSKKVYITKETVTELTQLSIESCLAFCSNLNGKVNCGTN